MSNGDRIVVIPRNNPVNAFTMGGIVRDAGLTPEQFRDLLYTESAERPGTQREQRKQRTA